MVRLTLALSLMLVLSQTSPKTRLLVCILTINGFLGCPGLSPFFSNCISNGSASVKGMTKLRLRSPLRQSLTAWSWAASTSSKACFRVSWVSPSSITPMRWRSVISKRNKAFSSSCTAWDWAKLASAEVVCFNTKRRKERGCKLAMVKRCALTRSLSSLATPAGKSASKIPGRNRLTQLAKPSGCTNKALKREGPSACAAAWAVCAANAACAAWEVCKPA